jgi:glycosyltransferase involved in cell wall biosynthesis
MTTSYVASFNYARLQSCTFDFGWSLTIFFFNPKKDHVEAVQRLAKEVNESSLNIFSNYFVYVIHYGDNRGASFARNTGFNYTTADWVLFLDDDVIPDEHILDAYAGAIRRYPDAKVLVGMTELPDACNSWTEMLRACNVGYFYAIAKR